VWSPCNIFGTELFVFCLLFHNLVTILTELIWLILFSFLFILSSLCCIRQWKFILQCSSFWQHDYWSLTLFGCLSQKMEALQSFEICLSQSTWGTIQENLNLQNFIIRAVVYINLATKVIKMFHPRNSLASSQTHGSWEYILELRRFVVDLVVPYCLLWVCCNRLRQTVWNSVAMERKIREIRLLHSLHREWCQLQ
jgi:hypothetical protein